MIVLHKVGGNAGQFRKAMSIETFKEESAGVAEHGRFDNHDIGDLGGNDFHVEVR
jgi:hypothetical protein